MSSKTDDDRRLSLSRPDGIRHAQGMLAVIAIVLSALSLAWNIFNAFYRRPRIYAVLTKHVDVTINVSAGTSIEEYRFRVTAINAGAEASTIIDAGVRDDSGVPIASVVNLRLNGVTVEGPELPARIEAYGGLTWTIPHSATAGVPLGQNLWGWVARHRKQGKRGGPISTVTAAPVAEVKGSRVA